MNETYIGVFIALLAVMWLAWFALSETRHKHGFWVALLLPLAPIILPILWLGYLIINYGSCLVFKLMGRSKEDHEAFMDRLKVRWGVFLLF